ncbi:unnamed protein product [Ixodes persulcatus]
MLKLGDREKMWLTAGKLETLHRHGTAGLLASLTCLPTMPRLSQAKA